MKVENLVIVLLTELDPDLWTPLAPHLHKTICFQIGDLAFYFKVEKTGLVAYKLTPECDVTFSGPPSAFVNMLLSKKINHPELHIRGDMECAKALYDAWHHFDIDWEGQIAKVFGNTLSHGIYEGLQTGHHWLKQMLKNRRDDLIAYIQDEKQYLPTHLEMETFLSQIDNLRDDVENFAIQVTLFEQRVNKGS